MPRRLLVLLTLSMFVPSVVAPRLWDLSTGKELRRFVVEDEAVEAVAFAIDGRTVALACGNEVRFWNTISGRETRHLVGHSQRVRAVVFVPDGRTVASASEDGTVRLWETISGLPIIALTGLGDGLGALAVGPLGRLVAATDRKGGILLWNLPADPGLRPATADLPRLWNELGGNDAGKARRHMACLVAAPKESVAFLVERLRPIAPAAEGQVDKLIADLDSPRFVDRQKAAHELERLEERAELALCKALAAKPSLETQRRLNDLLKPLETLTPARLRSLRAVQVLEDIGTPEARQVLESLAGGAPEALLTQEAKDAVRRLAK